MIFSSIYQQFILMEYYKSSVSWENQGLLILHLLFSGMNIIVENIEKVHASKISYLYIVITWFHTVILEFKVIVTASLKPPTFIKRQTFLIFK